MKTALIQEKEIIFNRFGKTFVKERLKVSDGNELDWYYLDSPASVLIVPLTNKGELILTKLFRYNLKKHVYEIPAGAFDDLNEDFLTAAKRELLEETGYIAKKFIDLGKHYILPSETNRWVHCVLALDVKKKEEPKLDDVIEKYFDISVELVSFEKTVEKIGHADSIIEGVEHGYTLLLAGRYLRDHSKQLTQK